MLRHVLVELLEERKPEFQELIVEALEDVALARAIRDSGRSQGRVYQRRKNLDCFGGVGKEYDETNSTVYSDY